MLQFATIIVQWHMLLIVLLSGSRMLLFSFAVKIDRCNTLMELFLFLYSSKATQKIINRLSSDVQVKPSNDYREPISCPLFSLIKE
ncbi:hypothetical protein H5410_033828, partial [Solanum commersonii]